MHIVNEKMGYGYSRHIVNGIGLTSFDFGNTRLDYDEGGRKITKVFIPKPAAREILEKYHITGDEYNKICITLAKQFTDEK